MHKNGTTESAAQGIDDKIDSLKDTVKGFVDQGAQRVDAIRHKVVDAKDQAVSRGSDVLDRAASMIKAHPLKAVAVAFGAGYIGMRLFRR